VVVIVMVRMMMSHGWESNRIGTLLSDKKSYPTNS
jgi:hypothetical protein